MVAGVGRIAWRRRRIVVGVERLRERRWVVKIAADRSQPIHYVHVKNSYDSSNRWLQVVVLVVAVVLVAAAAAAASVIVVAVPTVPSFSASSVSVVRYCARSPD